MLSARADIRHDVQIILRTVFCTEAAGHLGLRFDVADISFRLVIIERNIEVPDKKAD